MLKQLTSSQILLLLVLVLFFLQECGATDTISGSETIRDPGELVSAGQTFKLGFFSPENTTNRYVGITMNVPSKEVVIWVANRDRPVKDSGGIVTFSEDGNLVVMNGQKEILWSTNVSYSVTNSSAQLLDTGNLVLIDNSNGKLTWESFQIPTDSFVQEMLLGGNRNNNVQLTSWRSPSDPSVGNFSFGIDPLRIPEFLIWNRGEPYWRSGPWNGNVYIGVPGMISEYQNRFQLINDNGSVFFIHSFLNDSAWLYYVLSSAGVLSENVLYKDSGNSTVTWTSQESECDVYGKCGPFGICNPRSSQICTCLQGFEPRDKEEWDSGNWTRGCSRRTLLQCDRNDSSSEEGKPDGFFKFETIKVPDLAELIGLLQANTEEQCGNMCLKNCSCLAFSYNRGIGCMHWSGNVIDIQQFSYDGADLHVRLAYSEIENADQVKGKGKKKAAIASIASVGSLFVAISAYLLWKCLTKHRGKGLRTEIFQEDFVQPKIEELPLYSFAALATATDDFDLKNKLGEGGFGPVYKGKLLNGQEIAVKRLSNSSSQGINELTNEVALISKLQHRNLVRLLGCCCERGEKMIIYEYMPNKSLDVYLFDSQKGSLLDWSRRVFIIEGIGRGLLYLHRDSRLKIIHRDLKASNILLDKELNPRISDFGLARIFECNQDLANTNRVVGTFGYMAPEYGMGGKFSEKSDVYSFGVLLLEIVSGERNCIYNDENGLSLIGYAWKLWNDNKAIELLYPTAFDPSIEKEVLRHIHVGLLCVQESAKDRPNICTVLSMLNSEISELPPPKLPAYTARICFSKISQYNLHSVNDVTLTSIHGR